ncbi:MAG TPA: glycine cleavage T C-terminal barrel domain-containing protein [Kofleriaceae bacterium]|nr:glycine cleavage T C-terminal barrel domain-containing protein [Kofleriaceae bacterium]
MTTTIDLSAWGHLEVTGSDRLRFLQGLTTINVSALPAGGHGWGAILSPKGRVLSVIEATVEAERVLLHCEPSLVDKTLALLDKYAVMDDVTSRAITLAAHKTWSTPAEAWTAPIVLAPPPAGALATAEEAEVARVEAGLLRYGQDVDEDAFPFETPIGRFLDYQKGCYVGQEPVFRVYAQGQAARALRGLVIDGDRTVAVASGDEVSHPTRAKAGVVTSAVVSPRLGSIAMAYLHRTTWEVGGEVTVAGRTAKVVELPFG